MCSVNGGELQQRIVASQCPGRKDCPADVGKPEQCHSQAEHTVTQLQVYHPPSEGTHWCLWRVITQVTEVYG